DRAKCVQDWGVETPFDANPAKQLAAALKGSVSVLYGLGSYQAVVANRWKGQINENAKNLTFANAFPELNHNEILGWVKAKDQGVGRWVAVILEDGRESAKMKERARVTTELISGVCEVHRVKARGESLLERMLSLTLFGDFVSLYLAALNDVDPENIDSINVLKKALAAVPG
ncbi:MAG: SIS domain-containing protein, partial [Fimbriimonadaceae bacterium]